MRCKDAHSNNDKNDEKGDINSTRVLVIYPSHLSAGSMIKIDRSDDTSVSRTKFLQIEPADNMHDREKHRLDNVSPQNNEKSVKSCGSGFYIQCRGQRKCKDLFENADAMKNHVQTYHVKKQIQNTFECYFCKKIVTEKQSLQRHFNAMHTDHLMFKCTYPKCSESFKRKCNLKKHINGIHTKKKAYACDKCPMKYYYKYLLSNHLAHIHGIRKRPIHMESMLGDLKAYV